MRALLVGGGGLEGNDEATEVLRRCRAVLDIEQARCTCVPLGQLARQLLEGGVTLVVIDGETCRRWLPELLEELSRRWFGGTLPEIVVAGGRFEQSEAARYYCGGVRNWVDQAGVRLLSDHWRWANRAAQNTSEHMAHSAMLAWLRGFVEGRQGFLDVFDGQLNVRFPIVDGRLGPCVVRELETPFTRAIVAASARSGSAADTPPQSGDWRTRLVERGMWQRAVLREACEVSQRRALHWLLGTNVQHLRWSSGLVEVAWDFTWELGSLVSAGETVRLEGIRGKLKRAQRRVANDTTLAEVS